MTHLPCLSLWQPWASLIALGCKRVETRGWCAPSWLVGRELVIHAAKRWTAAEREALQDFFGFSEVHDAWGRPKTLVEATVPLPVMEDR